MRSIQLIFGVILVTSEVLSIQLFPVLNLEFSSENSSLCSKHVGTYNRELENQTLWAMRMFDASAQGTTGALYGNMWQLGNFDECLNLKAPFPTKYCLVTVQLQVLQAHGSVWKYFQETRDGTHIARDTLHTAVCVPAACSASQLEQAFQEQLDLKNHTQVQYKVTTNNHLCTDTVEVGPFLASEIFFWATCVLIIIFVVLGTIVRNSNSDMFFIRLLRCFSFPCNIHRLFRVLPEESSHPLAVLHGVKVLSIVLVFYGHRSSMPLGIAVSNYQEIEEHLKTAHNMFLPQADLVVDTFFFISGVLATYFLYHMMSKKAVNPIHALFVRISRIAPIYYLIVWFQASSATRLGSGPMWKFIQGQETSNCVNYWWANLLFINNYLPADKIPLCSASYATRRKSPLKVAFILGCVLITVHYLCHVHSWFLPCDLHFFILAFLSVYILVKKPLIGKTILLALTLLTPVLPAYLVYTYAVDPMIIFYDSFLSDPRSSMVFDMLYIKSHIRITVYLIGIIVGYFLYLQSDSKYKMTKAVTIWSIILGVSLLFTPMAVGGLYYEEEPPGRAVSIVYAALRRPLWALGLSVLLMVHRFGPTNMISRALSSHLALVLSKLTFTIYLVHYMLILYNMAKRRTPIAFSIFDLIVQGSGDLVTTCIYAGILYVFLELPFKRIFRELAFRNQVQQGKECNKQPLPQDVFTAKL